VSEACRRWRPTPAIQASAAFHLGGIAAIAVDPLSWPYVGAALAGNHALLGIAGMCPRSALLGPNLRRLPRESVIRREIALTFDDGPHPEITPRVLDILERYRARASFFCVGSKAAARPDLVQEIARRGHTIENHSQHHPGVFAAYGPHRLRREIEAAQETLTALVSRPPRFFRAPAGLRSPLLDPVLARLGLTYVSWTRRGLDTIDANPATVLRRLTRGLTAGDVLTLHDRPSARTSRKSPVVVSVLPALLDRIHAQNLEPVSLQTACNA
jgi:peptidoglycan/xylan/chitin deacetylase (PgdA/CDA1 family)